MPIVRDAVSAVLAAALPLMPQVLSSTGCQSNIVSSSVVATVCSHRDHDVEVLDLLILWRGKAGWFQRGRGMGSHAAGSTTMGGGMRGSASWSQSYGDVEITYEADFDARRAIVGQDTFDLRHVNTVVIENADGDWRTGSRRWTNPDIPPGIDVNLALARKWPAIRADLRCAIPMPPPDRRVQQPRVVTVCEKLQSRSSNKF
jgi:hypothetical protein